MKLLFNQPWVSLSSFHPYFSKYWFFIPLFFTVKILNIYFTPVLNLGMKFCFFFWFRSNSTFFSMILLKTLRFLWRPGSIEKISFLIDWMFSRDFVLLYLFSKSFFSFSFLFIINLLIISDLSCFESSNIILLVRLRSS